MINKLEVSDDDRIFFIGDLIDKGPDSVGVVQYVEQLSKEFELTLLLGNHEEKFLRYVNHRRTNSKDLALMSNTEDFEVLFEALNEAQLKMLEGSYYTYYLKEYNRLLLHAGIPGNVVFELKRSIPYTADAKKHYKNINLILMTRMLDKEGRFVGLGQAGGEQFWAEGYAGEHGNVIFGHEAFIQDSARNYPFATGIDTGCVYGGWLTAIILEEDRESTVQVKAFKTYCDHGEK